MAGAVIVGAALRAELGVAFSQLFETVKNVTNNARMFETDLKRIKSTLLKVEEIGLLEKDLGLPEEETMRLIVQMREGKERVSKYSKIPWWNYSRKHHYRRKLCQLEEALVGYFKVDMEAQVFRIGLETSVGVNDIRAKLNLGMRNAWMSCAVPPPSEFIVGLDLPLKELKTMLLNEEVSSLVLTAPGGCGKTTLVKMLGHDEEIKGIFKDNIFFVHASKTPNLKVIVQKLIQHKGYQVPEFLSDEDAIEQLEQLLNQIRDPILLILDDAWPRSEPLLEKFKFHMPNYKILVTSRTEFPRFDFTYMLEPLNDKDAMTLFLHSITLRDGSSCIPDGDDIVRKIVKLCGGFPLALITIGRSLCGEPSAVWQSKVIEWSSGHSILDSNGDLLVRLKRSLEFSDNEVINKEAVTVMECFMDLGSFPENQRIPVATLIDMWEQLYELDGKQAIAILHEISARNLVSLTVTRKDASEVGSYYSEDFVFQHDLLRELAIHQSSQEPIEQRKRLIMDISENNLPKWWTEQRQQPISARFLSISTDEMFSSSWCNILPAKVEVLVLNFWTNNYTLPEFLEKMDQLKVLIVTNYGSSPAELGNFQLLGSVPNLKRIRLEKVSIPSLCKTPVQLKSLKKISLFMCHIGQAFKNCNIQISYALPNLTEINIDYCNDLVELPAELCDIVSLNKLSITNCHKLSALPEGMGKLGNLEGLRLRSCTDLSELPESVRNLHNLYILDISDCLSIRKLPKDIGELRNLKELHMKGCGRLLNQLPQSTMDLKQLELVICDEEMKANFWEPIKLEFLTSLEIKVMPEKDINMNWLPIHF